MAGKIRTREKCAQCDRAFKVVEEQDIICTACGTRPKSFFIFLYWQKRKHRLTRDQDGHILDSYRRARRLLEKMRSGIDSRTFVIENYLPIEVEQFRGHLLFNKWFHVLNSRGNALSYTRKIRQYINDHFIPQLGQINMRDIKTHHVEDFRTYLTTQYLFKRRKNQDAGVPLSPKSVKNVMDALREFCAWLYKREIITRVPHFDPIQVPERLVQVMLLPEREKAFAHIRSPLQRAIIGFLIKHPARTSEACALDVRHFDLVNRIVTIEQALDCDGSLKPRKNRKAYEIPLSREWDDSCVRGRFGKELAFPNAIGKRYNAHTLNEAWKRACEKAGVEYVSIYPSTRHTTATSYASRGAKEEEIEAMLGHSTRGMSRKYIKRSVEMLRHLVDNGAQMVHISEKGKLN